MKKAHLATLLLAAAAVAVILSTFGSASRYVSFAQARSMQQEAASPVFVHVIGQLPKQKKGQAWEIKGIEEATDHRSFTFLLRDEKGETQSVRYTRPVPVDFRRAEKVVIVGYATPTYFHAEKILLKCPSKYEEEMSPWPQGG